ncbi:MAG: DUF1553 domain-containing protein [Saprospiraceae bacterium]|nr:DUF1553 domain-containing protein [Saprospiraceae bacterium]
MAKVFSKGIVTTPHDFGLQGNLPSHPELLDYLAFEIVQNDWDLRHLIRTIVNSKTYKQSSEVSKGKRILDPDNVYLSRGPANRLTAEMIRDQALAAAFLLDTTVGGPSVKPWQPEGLWEEKTSSTHLLQSYVPDTGANRYRRSMYTFVRRTSMHPMMEIFDAPTRSVCVAKRQNTDSPVQALVLLNEPQFIEAARCLAEKMLVQCHDPAERISMAYQRLCSKKITEEKLFELTEFYEEEKKRFKENEVGARSYVSIGQYAPDFDGQTAELASLTLTFNTIMNLDDFYYKR